MEMFGPMINRISIRDTKFGFLCFSIIPKKQICGMVRCFHTVVTCSLLGLVCFFFFSSYFLMDRGTRVEGLVCGMRHYWVTWVKTDPYNHGFTFTYGFSPTHKNVRTGSEESSLMDPFALQLSGQCVWYTEFPGLEDIAISQNNCPLVFALQVQK